MNNPYRTPAPIIIDDNDPRQTTSSCRCSHCGYGYFWHQPDGTCPSEIVREWVHAAQRALR